MLKGAKILLLIALGKIFLADVARAQLQPPLLPQLPNAQVPRGCPPGQFCGNAPQFGFRCQTPQFWCALPQPGPIGIACHCNSPLGTINGLVQP